MFVPIFQLILVMASMGSLMNAPERDLGGAVLFSVIILGVCLMAPLQHIKRSRKYFAAENPHAIDVLPELKKRRRQARLFNGLYGAVLGIIILFTGFVLLIDFLSDKDLVELTPRMMLFAVIYIGLALAYRWYANTLHDQIARLEGQKSKQVEEAVAREDIKALPQEEMAALSQLRFRYIGYLALVIAGVWAFLSAMSDTLVSLTNASFWVFAGIAYAMALPYTTRAYQEHVKRAFLPGLLAKHNLTYSDKPVFEMAALSPHGIIQPYSDQKIDDAFSGTINGRQIAVQEFVLDRVIDEENKENRGSFFGFSQKGLAVRIPLNRKLQCHTLVFSKNRLNMVRLRFAKYKPVGLLNTKLNEHYEVYANDQVEARYIFDPAFMERFAELIHQLPIADIEASFKDEELVILCLQGKDYFQIGSLFTPLKPESFEPVTREIETFTRIVELLALDEERGL